MKLFFVEVLNGRGKPYSNRADNIFWREPFNTFEAANKVAAVKQSIHFPRVNAQRYRVVEFTETTQKGASDE